jgi:hypothetical protein
MCSLRVNFIYIWKAKLLNMGYFDPNEYDPTSNGYGRLFAESRKPVEEAIKDLVNPTTLAKSTFSLEPPPQKTGRREFGELMLHTPDGKGFKIVEGQDQWGREIFYNISIPDYNDKDYEPKGRQEGQSPIRRNGDDPQHYFDGNGYLRKDTFFIGPITDITANTEDPTSLNIKQTVEKMRLASSNERIVPRSELQGIKGIPTDFLEADSYTLYHYRYNDKAVLYPHTMKDEDGNEVPDNSKRIALDVSNSPANKLIAKLHQDSTVSSPHEVSYTIDQKDLSPDNRKVLNESLHSVSKQVCIGGEKNGLSVELVRTKSRGLGSILGITKSSAAKVQEKEGRGRG